MKTEERNGILNLMLFSESGEAFKKRFGTIYIEESTGKLSYNHKNDKCKGRVYEFPVDATASQVEGLIGKSLSDGIDYVFQLVKNNFWDYNPNLLY